MQKIFKILIAFYINSIDMNLKPWYYVVGGLVMTRGRLAILAPAVHDELDKEFFTGVQLAARKIGFDILVFTGIPAVNTDSYAEGEGNIYTLPFSTRIDGIILAVSKFHDEKLKASILNLLEKSRVPSVSVGEKHGKITEVSLDQSRFIYDITEHLILSHGYKELICLTGPERDFEALERARGFIEALEKYGIKSENRIIYGDFWRVCPVNLAEKIATGEMTRPEAIVCTNDIMAVTLCRELLKYGINVPMDIAVTGYDGSLYTLLTKPAITTVSGAERCLGMLAVKELAAKLGINADIDCDVPKIRFGGSCGCHNEAEGNDMLLRETEAMLNNKLNRKPFMFSNYIVKMSDCKSLPKFAAVLNSLRYMLPDCRTVNVCLCEDWNIEQPEYRKNGYSENMRLIYSENQPGQLPFSLNTLLPQLNREHEPQFWVFTSLHYFDRILGYIATSYDEAEQFAVDEHYISWCDAVANGLDIVTKKENVSKMWARLEERSLTDIYTGLLSRKGFVSRLSAGENVMLLSFPDRYAGMQYFVPAVSVVLRSDEGWAHFGETIFGAVICGEDINAVTDKLCRSLSELGIYVKTEELNILCRKIVDNYSIDEQLSEMYHSLTEKGTTKRPDAYFDIFSDLRNEMKYSPQTSHTVALAAARTGLSGSHFQRLYKKYFSVSFNEELIGFKLERAKYLLKNTAITIQQIAEECGYADAAHFMRQFKERVGMSAGSYRKWTEN